MVRDRRDYAAVGGAVAGERQVTVKGRGVVGVDPVPGSGKSTFWGVRVVVGPGGGGEEGIGCEERTDCGGGVGGEVAGGEEGGGAVSEHAPGGDRGEEDGEEV